MDLEAERAPPQNLVSRFGFQSIEYPEEDPLQEAQKFPVPKTNLSENTRIDLSTHVIINESNNLNNLTCNWGSKAPTAILSLIKFFDKVVQLTAKPLEITPMIFIGWIALETGYGSLKTKIF